MEPKVLIVGGGIAGLCLAQGLKKHNIPFHVYERDANTNYRGQGYRIRVAFDAIDALRYCLDDEIWRLFELTCAECNPGPIPEVDAISCKVEGVQMEGGSTRAKIESTARPRTADRKMLRETLLLGLDGHISWGKKFMSYDINAEGVKVNFADGTSAHGSLLVGADGTSSRVKAQFLPGQISYDTGSRVIYGKTPLNAEVEKAINPAITQRMSAIKDRSQGDMVFAMILEPVRFRNREAMKKKGFDVPEDYIYWVAGSKPEVMGLPPGPVPSTSFEDSAGLVTQLTQGWDPSLRCLIDHQAPGQSLLIALETYSPDLPAWEPNKRITFMGDAIHGTVPAGTGGITALKDAHHLCEKIVSSVLETGGVTDKAVGEYEAMMREYAPEIMKKSTNTTKAIFQQTVSSEINAGEVMMQNRGEERAR